MSELAYYESRNGSLNCSDVELFEFVTDVRNFEQFVRGAGITDWKAEKKSCSFKVSMIGTVSLHIAESEKYRIVTYRGDALNKNDFSLILNISGSAVSSTDVKVSLSADLNPMLRMMAAKPIAQFLELLINKMESISDWKDLKE